ncbi:MAG: hypothetical protein M0Z55_12135, partial [Peptococcaceae bacterium]|nr:hypothetical protein [Peptococcaceae bacterium]
MHDQTVLDEFFRARMNEEAVSVERVYFYKTDKRVNPKQEDPMLFFPGTLPVLVSAPHSVRHWRNKKIKVSDQFTGAIAYLLHKLTGCSALAVAKLYGGDPNHDNPCIYKTRIGDICDQTKLKLVLDLHGAAREHEFDVDLGTAHGQNLLGCNEIQQVLERNLREFGLGKVERNHFAAAGPNTVANFAAQQLGIPAVQLEINKQYRVPAQNPSGFHRLLAALAASIEDLSSV